MIKLYIARVTAWFCLVHSATTARRREDRGVTTLEIVIIALGLLGVATLAIAAIRSGVQSRVNKIN